MSNFICKSCRKSLRDVFASRGIPALPRRSITNSNFLNRSVTNRSDIHDLLKQPTWSVRSLLPPADAPASTEITPEKLHHLLRLSALPLPKSPEEEASMLETLHTQLHFVKAIQKVDTEGIEPLQSIRDETKEGIEEITIGLEQLEGALRCEDIKGRNRRPRRRRGEPVDAREVQAWDVLGPAEETKHVSVPGEQPHGYFVVNSGKGLGRSNVNTAKEGIQNDS